MKRAVVVDDDPINNLICERLLKHSGKFDDVHSFLIASDGLDWLIALSVEQQPELLLLDINMPVMDGWAFLNALNQRLPKHKIRIAILSSSISEDDRLKASLQPSPVDYLIKPLTLEKLAPLLLNSR